MPSASEVETPVVEATVRVKVLTPSLPNFLRVGDGNTATDIADIPDAVLRQVGDAWTAALVARAHMRRQVREVR